MPTNFLPVGIINEQLEELAGLAAHLSAQETADQSVAEMATRIYELASQMLALINGFSCQPLIFTGSGSTEEIISRLEWLLAFADEQPQSTPNNRKKGQSKAR